MSQIYFIWCSTLHVSDGLSVHHQELKTVHTATGVCQTDTAVCLLASRQQYLFDKCLLLYVESRTSDDGRKDLPKHAECYSKYEGESKSKDKIHLTALIEITVSNFIYHFST